jgi:eukaryotic-like serine/threonine-protein kinase
MKDEGFGHAFVEILPMSDDARVNELLKELLDSGSTPEEVCRTCPELLAAVRAGWQQVRVLQAEVAALFPVPPSVDSASPNASLPPAPPRSGLPYIPGYELQELLGRGGMGVVYKAWHRRLNRGVALKMLLAGPYAQPQELERFLREAETVAGLRHAHIVQVYEAGDVDGRPYFIMEFVEGGSLAHKLAGTPQPARQAAALVAKVAEAVQVAHQGGIVHRDLKPANILLTGDGTPKITDFGLARRLEGEARLTQSGIPVGTPSYMAPEQAEGRSSDVGPAADIYALGAILYELLTGRPPFRTETAVETLRQVIAQDPVPPSRLNAAVPRDVETICLKCLEKDPRRRYASALAFAEDLQRFGRNEPIVARPVGPTERALRWTQRHPTAAALVATALALLGLAIGGGVWLVQQRAERRAELRSEVGTAEVQAVSLRRQFHFHEAQAFLDQARRLVEPAGPDELRRRVDQAQAQLDLVAELDTARLRTATPVKGKFEPAGAEPLYEEAFVKAGLGRPGDDSEAVAARVGDSTVRAELVAALDDWAWITQDPARQAWLLTVARRADPDPVRDRLRQPELWRDGPALTKVVQETNLVRKVRVAELSPQFLTALGRALRLSGGEAVPLLRAAQARFPKDFWLNHQLGLALETLQQWDEALGYLRVAAAMRPDIGLIHLNVGVALYNKGRLDEAIEQFQEALRLDPEASAVHWNLGGALYDKGRLDEAIEHFQEAIRLDPNSAGLHINLGVALFDKGQVDEAIRHYQEAIRLEPKTSALAHRHLGTALQDQGRSDEAIGHFQQAVRLDANLARAGTYLFNCLFASGCAAVRTSTDKDSGRLDEKQRAGLRRQALERLRASLELRTKLIKEGGEAGWGCSLSPWQTDPALAGVRDREALAKLPDAEREQWQRLWADVAALLAEDPLVQGAAHAASREWNKAADCYSRALLAATDNGESWFECAAVLLLSGDRLSYAKVCAHMVERCGKPNLRAYHVARACTLAPDAVAEASRPGRLADSELKTYAGEFWSLTEQGALHYRAGRFLEAVARLEQSLHADSKPGHAVLNWLWLAMAQQRLGKSKEARRWLDKATAWLDRYRDGMPARAEEELGLDLHNWLEAHVLRREAEALIRGR